MSLKIAILSACLMSIVVGIFALYLHVAAQQRQEAADFMSTLTKCDNCQLKKPFLGSGKDETHAR
jgi:hypothetical protein